MGTFTSTQTKAFIRKEWGKSLLSFLHNNLGYKLVYMGLPSPDAEDIFEWLEHLDKIIAFQCRDYPNPSDRGQSKEVVNQLETKLLELKRKKKLSKVAVYDGYIEEVVLNGHDNSHIPMNQQETVMVYNLDFCNQITSPLNYMDANGESRQAYKFQAIRKLLQMQNEIDEKAQKFVMFLTIHAGYDDNQLSDFISDPGSEDLKEIINGYSQLSGINKKARILRVFIIETLRRYFQNFDYLPRFLPTIFYRGTNNYRLLHFTVIGTRVEPQAGMVGWHQRMRALCRQKLLSVNSMGLIPFELDGFEETNVARNPVETFKHSKTYRENWNG